MSMVIYLGLSMGAVSPKRNLIRFGTVCPCYASQSRLHSHFQKHEGFTNKCSRKCSRSTLGELKILRWRTPPFGNSGLVGMKFSPASIAFSSLCLRCIVSIHSIVLSTLLLLLFIIMNSKATTTTMKTAPLMPRCSSKHKAAAVMPSPK